MVGMKLVTTDTFYLFVHLYTCVCLWQYKEGKKLKPKPNYNSVDLAEVEWEDTEEKVRSTHSPTSLSLSVSFILCQICFII